MPRSTATYCQLELLAHRLAANPATMTAARAQFLADCAHRNLDPLAYGRSPMSLTLPLALDLLQGRPDATQAV